MADQADGVNAVAREGEPSKKILLIAGEESGDVYAGGLIRELLSIDPELGIEGIGGPRMREAGANTFYDITQMSAVGVAATLGKLWFFLNVLSEIKEKIAIRQYDAVILIDYPDFNMRIAKAAWLAGIPVYYYVCPQFWGWRRYRIRFIAKWVKMMLVVFPFEQEIYIKEGIDARFMGHPLLDTLEPAGDIEIARRRFGALEDELLLGILPGSRHGEISRMFPVMLDALGLIRDKFPCKAVVACAGSIETAKLREMADTAGADIEIAEGATWEIMNACDFLICKSGTSTLQAAIARTPMVICYRSDAFSYWLVKRLTHVKWAGLPNLLAGREIVPELLGDNMTASQIAKEVIPYLESPVKRNEMIQSLEAVAASLGEKGAARRAAEVILEGL